MRLTVIVLLALTASAFARPKICPDLCETVCGADGKDYCNGCLAGRAGTTVAHTGSCTSGNAPAPTQCMTTPPSPLAKCPRIYKPVCGCDGKTYSNACGATNAGVSTTTAGACKAVKKHHRRKKH